MNRHYVPVARIFGISIGLDYSWFLIFVLFTWSLAASYYPAAYPAWPQAEYWILGAITALMLFGSVLLHELGHAVVAIRYNIPVLRIVLFIYINGALALFNLIPGFPLDGGRILRAIIWSSTHSFRKATLIAATVGRIIAFFFIVWGVGQIFAGQLGNGLWIAFIGWFLESAATAQVQQQVADALLAGHTVSEAMNPHYANVQAATLLQDLVDRHILGSGGRSFIVTRDGEVVGLVTVHQVAAVPRDRWSTTTAADAMTPIARVKRIRPNTGLWAAMAEMDHDGVNQLPVTEDGRVLGMLTRGDVISYLRTLQELGR